ncbi:SBBP repeat-containing protein [Acidovorax sp. JG5]|uniref:SBBP repeat-containing protein n=1 Tax=Acidovorax sp. JG5 TaxID=2822718 RepID=UPI001B328C26|nr:SBBP repeat-containing protein [Acidovorax sp. JG5]MBP3982176.1 SBBP repeat-containing protein [Acidovorax sp. JG5]
MQSLTSATPARLDRWVHRVATLCLSLALAACGGGDSEELKDVVSVSVKSATASTMAAPDVTLTSITKLSETRVSRTVFDYVFQISVKNNGTQALSGVTATLKGVGAGTTIVDGTVQLGNLAAGVTVTPQDTITLRQDRTVAFSPGALSWTIVAAGPVGAAWAGIREDGAPKPGSDTAYAVATDASGNVFVAGKSEGVLPGSTGSGLPDPFVAKYSASGDLLWIRSILTLRSGLGTTDSAYGVATDSIGNVYVTGDTVDTLPGETKAGGRDAFIAKFDGNGNRLWAHLLGTTGTDQARAIAVDGSGNAYIVGASDGRLPLQPPGVGELFIAKFDTNGSRQWIHQWGSGGDGANRDASNGVAVDAAGNAYMTGYIPFNYAGTTPGGSGDAFAAKYDSNGNQVWFSRFKGMGNDQSNAIAVAGDGNTIYLTGRTNSDFDLPGFPAQTIFCCGTPDAFIARLDGNGSLQWIHNLSSPSSGPTHFDDRGFGVATDATGSVAFIAGYTNGAMPGETSKGFYDPFVARYEGNGTRTWVRQFGSSLPSTAGIMNLWDHAFGIALDPAGDLFVVGDSIGTFGAPNPSTGHADWFVMKLRPADGTLY